MLSPGTGQIGSARVRHDPQIGGSLRSRPGCRHQPADGGPRLVRRHSCSANSQLDERRSGRQVSP